MMPRHTWPLSVRCEFIISPDLQALMKQVKALSNWDDVSVKNSQITQPAQELSFKPTEFWSDFVVFAVLYLKNIAWQRFWDEAEKYLMQS